MRLGLLDLTITPPVDPSTWTSHIDGHQWIMPFKGAVRTKRLWRLERSNIETKACPTCAHETKVLSSRFVTIMRSSSLIKLLLHDNQIQLHIQEETLNAHNTAHKLYRGHEWRGIFRLEQQRAIKINITVAIRRFFDQFYDGKRLM